MSIIGKYVRIYAYGVSNCLEIDINCTLYVQFEETIF
mgnify:CR=1 FL=1